MVDSGVFGARLQKDGGRNGEGRWSREGRNGDHVRVGNGNNREAPRRKERVRHPSCLLTSSPISSERA